MFRSMSRFAAVAVIALTLALVSAPAVQASPFGAGASLDTRAGWFDEAMTWLSGLLFGEKTPDQPTFAADYATMELEEGGSIMSGGCIDPEGRPRPCY